MYKMDLNKLTAEAIIASKGNALAVIRANGELGELIQAISKALEGNGSYNSIAEELADVILAVELIRLCCGIKEEDVNKWIEFKHRRDTAKSNSTINRTAMVADFKAEKKRMLKDSDITIGFKLEPKLINPTTPVKPPSTDDISKIIKDSLGAPVNVDDIFRPEDVNKWIDELLKFSTPAAVPKSKSKKVKSKDATETPAN